MDHTLTVSASSIETFIIPLIDGVGLASVVDACDVAKCSENGLLDVLCISVCPLERVVMCPTQAYCLCIAKTWIGTGCALQLSIAPLLCRFELIVGCPLVGGKFGICKVDFHASRKSASTPESIVVEP
jgi:hypothetical protein